MTASPNLAIRKEASLELTLGINIYREAVAGDAGAVDMHIREELPRILSHHNESMPEGFALARRLYRTFRIDPTKYRPASEALWRRLIKKGDFPRVTPFVDITNLLSLKFQVCFGLYDIDEIEGDVLITVGGEDDQYLGIRKDLLHMNGKPVLKDSQGAFGNPSADSLRTSVGAGTTDILQVLFFHPEHTGADEITREACDTCRRFFEPASFSTVML